MLVQYTVVRNTDQDKYIEDGLLDWLMDGTK